MLLLPRVVLPAVEPALPCFEEPIDDTAVYVGCSKDLVCRRQDMALLTAFCARGHKICMIPLDAKLSCIVFRDEQKGGVVDELKLTPMGV
jgi:hypothetical protein